MLKDVGAELDRMTDLYINNGWKSSKVVFGPFWYMLGCVHPDTVKVILKGGVCLFSHAPVYSCPLALPSCTIIPRMTGESLGRG